MPERKEKIKKHFKENKKVYIASTCGALVGAVVATSAALAVIYNAPPNNGAQIIQKITQIGWRHENTATVVQFIERSTPSKPVHLVGTNLYFSSLSEAARETGHQLSMISQNVNGHIPDVKGDVFELLELAS